MSRYNILNFNCIYEFYERFTDTIGMAHCNSLPTIGEFDISYGWDTACGYFIQFYPKDELARNWINNNPYIHDKECVDLDTVFSGLSGMELAGVLQILHESGFDIPQDHITLSYFDCGF